MDRIVRLMAREQMRDAAIAAAVAAMLAFPLLGFRLIDSAQGLGISARLSWVVYAALGVFAARLASLELRSRISHRLKPRPEAKIGWAWQSAPSVAVALFAAILPWLPFADANLVDRGTLILVYIVLGSGLNIVVALAGLLDLGYIAFFAVGAYSYALLSQHFGLSFWECLPLAGLAAAALGVALGFPVLRLRRDYLAVVTLGFGAIVHTILVNWSPVTGGPNGIGGIPQPEFFGHPFASAAASQGQVTFADYTAVLYSPAQRIYFLYYVIFALWIIVSLVVWRLRQLPLGRAWEALREDEIACKSLGLNPVTIKLTAFALGAAIAGLAGCFFATRQGFITPQSFTFNESALVLAIVVLGGRGRVFGIAVAAALFVGLPEWFRDIAQFRMLVFGAAMVAIVLWRPSGFVARRAPTIRLAKIAPDFAA